MEKLKKIAARKRHERLENAARQLGMVTDRMLIEAKNDGRCATVGCTGVRDHVGPCLPEMENPCPI